MHFKGIILININLHKLNKFSFLRHAKRSTVNADDVKLLVRRNDSLVSTL